MSTQTTLFFPPLFPKNVALFSNAALFSYPPGRKVCR